MAACCDRERSPFGWLLAAARYAAASMVTVLILLAIVKAIKVVLHPDSLYLSVRQGCLFTRREGTALIFQFSLQVTNPRRRARMSFINTKALLCGKDILALKSPAGCFVLFELPDATVPQRTEVGLDAEVFVTRDSFNAPVFDRLYSSPHASITGVEMRVHGFITHETASGSNNNNRSTTYFCWPLVVGVDRNDLQDFLGLNTVFCQEDLQGRHLI